MKPQTWFTLSFLLAPAQGSAGQQHLSFFLSIATADLGAVPDWKKTAFWCDDSFLQAYYMAKQLPPTQKAKADLQKLLEYAPTPLSKACSGIHNCLCLRDIVTFNIQSFAPGLHANQGVKRIRMSCGCMTGYMRHSRLKCGCLHHRPRNWRLHTV